VACNPSDRTKLTIDEKTRVAVNRIVTSQELIGELANDHILEIRISVCDGFSFLWNENGADAHPAEKTPKSRAT
jgi:hypothetical protein